MSFDPLWPALKWYIIRLNILKPNCRSNAIHCRFSFVFHLQMHPLATQYFKEAACIDCMSHRQWTLLWGRFYVHIDKSIHQGLYYLFSFCEKTSEMNMWEWRKPQKIQNKYLYTAQTLRVSTESRVVFRLTHRQESISATGSRFLRFLGCVAAPRSS